MILKTAIATFLEQTASWTKEATMEVYTQRLDRFSTFAKEREITTPLLLEYKAHLFQDGLKESSIAGYFVTLNLFLNWAVRCLLLPKNPMPARMGFVVTRGDRQPITEEEYLKFVAVAEKIQGYEYWPLAIQVGWHTGLRLGDVAFLRNTSLNVAHSAIRLIPKKTARFQRFVEIPIPEDLMDLLKYQSKGEFVFPKMHRLYTKTKKGRMRLSAQFLYIARQAQIRKSFHCLRHGFISRALNEMGVSPEKVSDMTGLNLNQLMTYCHIPLEDKREALGLSKKKVEVA